MMIDQYDKYIDDVMTGDRQPLPGDERFAPDDWEEERDDDISFTVRQTLGQQLALHLSRSNVHFLLMLARVRKQHPSKVLNGIIDKYLNAAMARVWTGVRR